MSQTSIRFADHQSQHFRFELEDGIATITLDRPERKNPLTFESYAELRDLFRSLVYAEDVHAVVICGAGGNFCSGGDVHEIIGPLTEMSMKDLLGFTRMTGDLIKAIRACPQVVISAIDGICAGAGAAIARLVTLMKQLGLVGAEFLAGIPGTLWAFFWRIG